MEVLSSAMCRCCASEGTFKDIHTKYHWMGDEEVYSVMLKECFDITLSSPQGDEGGICEVCITQLRNASNFKKQVLHTEEQFQQMLDNRGIQGIKIEYTKDSSEEPEDRPVSDANNSDSDFTPSIKEEEEEALESKPKTKKRIAKSTASRAKKPKVEAPETSTQSNLTKAQNFQQLFNASVKLVRLSDKVKNDKIVDIKPDFKCDVSVKKENEILPVKIPTMDMEKQLQNLNSILQCTNATPIRSQGRSGYRCGYCNDEYQKAEDLKRHTLEHHDPVTQKLLCSLNPSTYLVKLDITSLKCNLCLTKFNTLEEIMQHLKVLHKKDVHLHINNHMIPFKFDSKPLKCVLCSKTDEYFRTLQLHMSVHYNNYLCECGAACVTEKSLEMHKIKTHPDTQTKYTCRFCNKMFNNNYKKVRHEKVEHVMKRKISKCDYCEKKFPKFDQKRKHMTEMHGMEPRALQCNACDKVYSTTTLLRTHVRNVHLMERNFECEVCGKTFFSKFFLSNHMLKHSGVKEFECQLCSKAFFKKYTLTEHMRIHNNDKRFKCEHCGQRFLQKVGLKCHMRSKHGEVASENRKKIPK